MKKIITLLSCVLICASAGLIASIATISQVPFWYSKLIKPSFNPPNWIFGPVWLVLYLLMAVSLFIYISKPGEKTKLRGYLNFFLQLVLNACWSVIFFGLHQTYEAFYIIIILWFFILFTMLDFSRISRAAAYLLIPYVLWVSFASILNFQIWLLN